MRDHKIKNECKKKNPMNMAVTCVFSAVKFLNWAREKAQWLRALAALAEDQSLAPSTHTRRPRTTLTPAPGAPSAHTHG